MQTDPWTFLQTHTAARIAQGRAGHSLPTRALLDFQLDHACARDAVYAQLDTATLLNACQTLHLTPLLLKSQAVDRRVYLKRPDLGRRLGEASRQTLTNLSKDVFGANEPIDLCLVVADGLSATAVNRHALPVVSGLLETVRSLGWSVGPLCLVEQGRVAVGDEIGHALGAELLVVLIGERPGLSSPDSLGAYLTYRPRPGLTDESRNCVSNIRSGVDSSDGMPYTFAVQKLVYLLTEMKTRQLSGVGLKDEMNTLPTGTERAENS
ncbi:ethanolamine ammonia-lyase subunit EutC [Spirosoma montaniterrae]|uniref:Ethanolamine ammonia-lyase small subunit n=1 Tax=Spirosoma montaniterrae TaxID=1178516 RepID=A0A1P9WUZ9_9BACT|nr:ethanolamine ammonia-lyase subunit EutC [Spirosoma montaniterrae]AQG79201.1 ethanolamine ammonia-lyase [Spirosoma montaniterrae]